MLELGVVSFANGGNDLPYLFFAIFFLILIPIYMRLPFGWTKKGVALLLAVACLLSMFGMIAIEQFPLWQASLFLFLLVIASTYLLERKLGHLFYVRIHEHDFIIENEVEEERTVDQPIVMTEVTEEKRDDELQQEQVADFDVQWHEEVEQHMSNDEYDDMIAEMDDVIAPIHMVDGDDTSVNEAEWLQLLSEESDERELLNIEDHVVDELYDMETIVADDVLHADDDKQNEAMLAVAEAVRDNIEEKRDEAEHIPVIDIDEPSSDETIAEEANEPLRMLPKPFIKNLLASLYAMRPMMSDEQYEQFIFKHLHPQLHEQDYYTFANVLIEHYVASKQYEKLYYFAKQLYGQYEPYPIIQQQLAHMIHYAEQKMGWKK